MSSRELERSVRRNRDRLSSQIRDARSGGGLFHATVASVTGGSASDGLAVVTVTVRGDETTVAGYNIAYTPAVGQRVTCTYIDNQLEIVYAVGGAP